MAFRHPGFFSPPGIPACGLYALPMFLLNYLFIGPNLRKVMTLRLTLCDANVTQQQDSHRDRDRQKIS